MIICIDFDGTCVANAFPKVGGEIGAVPVLKKLVKEGHKLILCTMRSNRLSTKETGDDSIMNVSGLFLDDAVNWFKKHKIPLYGINENPTQKKWTSSPKPYGNLYIDDAAIGCPLKKCFSSNKIPLLNQYVDWEKVEEMLRYEGILP